MNQLMHPFFRRVAAMCLLPFLIILVGCEKQASSAQANTGQTEADDSGAYTLANEDAAQRRVAPAEADTPTPDAVMRYAGPSSFASAFPKLDSLTQSAPDLNADLRSYADMVLNPDKIRSEADILQVIDYRDHQIMERLSAQLLNADEGRMFEIFAPLDAELNRLGMQMNVVEGMFADLGPATFLEAEMNQYASRGFRLFMAYEHARTQSYNGEYPYLNMEATREMLQLGEQIMDLDSSPYPDQIGESYERALLAFMDIHAVKDPNARGGLEFFVSGLNTDHYPFVTENETRREFASQEDEDPLHEVMSRILDTPSTMTKRPNHLYLIVVEWADDEAMAKSRVISHLRKGEDVPHYLPVNLPDGTLKYAVVYRFFEAEELAENAFVRAQAAYPEAEFMMVSVRGQELFQIGA